MSSRPFFVQWGTIRLCVLDRRDAAEAIKLTKSKRKGAKLVIFDTFIRSGTADDAADNGDHPESPWYKCSGLTLVRPHGHDGTRPAPHAAPCGADKFICALRAAGILHVRAPCCFRPHTRAKPLALCPCSNVPRCGIAHPVAVHQRCRVR